MTAWDSLGIKMTRKIIAALLAVLSIFSLAACGKKSGEYTVYGFYDPNTKIEYVDVAPFGLYAVTRGDDYITVGEGESKTVYCEIMAESPESFLCVEDNGELLVVRNKEIEEPTIETFNPIAASIYDGNNTTFISRFYADEQYLDDANGVVGERDSALCQQIAKALVENEDTTVTTVSEDERFYIRLLSKDYPGLYYMVVFFGNDAGRYFLRDRATGKTVYCPHDIIARMVG